jgi:Nickel responsive protein SCO4226-like
MTEFMIELYAPRAGCDVVAAATARLGRAAAKLTAEGARVQVVRSIFVAEDETCFVLVEAASAEDVRAAATRAAVTFERIVETTFDIDAQPQPA